jgi:SAM (Sterile alpha motif) domain-containing protein
MEIDRWLRNLGLERYASAFIDNAVDVDVLPQLSEATRRDALNVPHEIATPASSPPKAKKPGEPTGLLPSDTIKSCEVFKTMRWFSVADAHPSDVLDTVPNNDAASDVAFGSVVIIITVRGIPVSAPIRSTQRAKRQTVAEAPTAAVTIVAATASKVMPAPAAPMAAAATEMATAATEMAAATVAAATTGGRSSNCPEGERRRCDGR